MAVLSKYLGRILVRVRFPPYGLLTPAVSPGYESSLMVLRKVLPTPLAVPLLGREVELLGREVEWWRSACRAPPLHFPPEVPSAPRRVRAAARNFRMSHN